MLLERPIRSIGIGPVKLIVATYKEYGDMVRVRVRVLAYDFEPKAASSHGATPQ